MKTNQDVKIHVNGYTDDKGGYTININLSEFRATSVKSYLVGKGIDMTRIKVKGYGSERPRSSNSSEEGRRLNRRVEIEIDQSFANQKK
jgi:outer membrane protein OmpA-like peptidoglycan-associated protein